ncbi:uncharacterized protein LOC126264236 [Aethina tumida]|uniref:uncharacterized protein LOC126264236 n=1 Tax=Aethina tumida TaxID=116153 RepID=UPI002147F207|nr:uncharacterized protein LOC126264236 [Aethina tumida]
MALPLIDINMLMQVQPEQERDYIVLFHRYFFGLMMRDDDLIQNFINRLCLEYRLTYNRAVDIVIYFVLDFYHNIVWTYRNLVIMSLNMFIDNEWELIQDNILSAMAAGLTEDQATDLVMDLIYRSVVSHGWHNIQAYI